MALTEEAIEKGVRDASEKWSAPDCGYVMEQNVGRLRYVADTLLEMASGESPIVLSHLASATRNAALYIECASRRMEYLHEREFTEGYIKKVGKTVRASDKKKETA